MGRFAAASIEVLPSDECTAPHPASSASGEGKLWGLMRYYEDFHVGEIIDLGSVQVNQADIIGFAQQYDPQPMHVNPDGASFTLDGGLIASGWHTGALHELAGTQPDRADQQPWFSGNGGAELAGSRTTCRYADRTDRGARHPALEQPADGHRSLARSSAQPA